MGVPDLRFLACFAAIYETRNLTRAAARLGRTQPAVTYQLRQLEDAVGGRLFERGRGGMTPTPLAEGLHALVDRFAAELADLQRGGDDADRPLAIAAVSAFGRHVLAPLLREAPRRVTLRFPTADEVIDRAVRGEIDLGFVFRPVTHAALVVEPVYEATYVLVADRAAARRLTSPARLDEVALVTYDEGDYVVGRWLGHHVGRRAPRWRTGDHFEELEEVLAAVAAGRGVAVVPDVCLAPVRGRVREVSWGRARVLNTVFAVRPRRAPLRPAVEDLFARVRRKSPAGVTGGASS